MKHLAIRSSYHSGHGLGQVIDANLPAITQIKCVSDRRIGLTGGDALTLAGERPILVAKLRESFEGWLPNYMAGGPP